MALTEPLFILLALLLIVALFAMLQGSARAWWWAAIIAALAFLLRYTGYTLILTALAVLWLMYRTSWRRKLMLSAGFAVISCLPMTVWFARNWRLTHTLMGPRPASAASLGQNLLLVLTTHLSWLFPPALVSYPLQAAFLMLTLALIAVLIFRIPHADAPSNPSRQLILICGIFIAVTLITQVISSTLVAVEPIGTRLLSPIYLPLLLLILLLLERILARASVDRWSKAVQMLLFIVIALWMAFPALQLIANTFSQVNDGAGGYNQRLWRENETLRYTAEHLSGSPIYVNEAMPVIFFYDLDIHALPAKSYFNSPTPITDLGTLDGTWPDQSPAYLVWFNFNEYGGFTVEELSTIADITLIHQFSDGAVYRIARHSR